MMGAQLGVVLVYPTGPDQDADRHAAVMILFLLADLPRQLNPLRTF